MAFWTNCLTPGTIFKTRIRPRHIYVDVTLPKDFDLTEEEAIQLERNLHNAIELALAPLFVPVKPPQTKRAPR